MPLYYNLQTLAESIAEQCKKARQTATGYRACCPAHNDKHPSLSILIGTERVTLHCFANCPADAIEAQLSLTPDERALIAHHRSLPALSPRPRAPKAPQEIHDTPAKRARLKQIWEQARPIAPGDPVGRYLRRRGLWQEPMPGTLRYHPRLPYHHDDGTFSHHPSLIAVIQNPDKTPVGMHRIYLAANGQKADVPSPKKLYIAAPWHGAAVRLGRAGPQLIVTEGIETGLAARKTSGYPVWAAISAGRFKTMVIPAVVELVIIAADNDENGVGQQAARTLADRLLQEGRRVKIAIPDTPGDWADGVQETYSG